MDDVLDAFDRRLDPLVPTGPAPVTDLVRRGRARRTRRRGLQTGLAAVVAVVAVATTTAVVQGRDAASPPASPAHSAPPTMRVDPSRVVGTDGIAVDVPADWVATEPCTDTPGALAFAQPGGSCSSALLVEIVSSPGIAVTGGGATLQHGIDVRRLDWECGPHDLCTRMRQTVMTAVEAHVSVAIATPEGYEGLRDQIAASVRPMPTGTVAVPPVANLTTAKAIRAIGEAGLEPVKPEVRVGVTGTEPGAGSVVPRGTVVSLAGPPLEGVRGAASIPGGSRLVGFQGVAAAIPAEWVSCPVLTRLGNGPIFGPPDAAGDCSGTDRVSFGPVMDTDLRDFTTVTAQAGLLVRTASGCDPRSPCKALANVRVLVADEDVIVRIGSSSQALAEAVLSSVRADPTGR